MTDLEQTALGAQRAAHAAMQALVSASIATESAETHARRLFLAALAAPDDAALVSAAQMAEARAQLARVALDDARRAQISAADFAHRAGCAAPAPTVGADLRRSFFARLFSCLKGA